MSDQTFELTKKHLIENLGNSQCQKKHFTTSRKKTKEHRENTSLRKAKMQKDGEPTEQNRRKD